jgi:hypothetical protein
VVHFTILENFQALLDTRVAQLQKGGGIEWLFPLEAHTFKLLSMKSVSVDPFPASTNGQLSLIRHDVL